MTPKGSEMNAKALLLVLMPVTIPVDSQPKQHEKFLPHGDRRVTKMKGSPLKEKQPCRSLFLVHLLHCRFVHPMRFVASKATGSLIIDQTGELLTEARYD